MLKKDFFEKYYYVSGHIIILKSFRNTKYYFKIMKLDLFAKVYDVLVNSIIMKVLVKNVILLTILLQQNSNFNGNFCCTEAGSRLIQRLVAYFLEFRLNIYKLKFNFNFKIFARINKSKQHILSFLFANHHRLNFH